MKIELFKYGYYIISSMKYNFWIYFQIGKYYLDNNWYEKRIAFDFFFRGKGISFCKVFEEFEEIEE